MVESKLLDSGVVAKPTTPNAKKVVAKPTTPNAKKTVPVASASHDYHSWEAQEILESFLLPPEHYLERGLELVPVGIVSMTPLTLLLEDLVRGMFMATMGSHLDVTPVVVTLDDRARANRTCGFHPDTWTSAKGLCHEISIPTECLRDPDAILQHLMHDLCHLNNYECGTKDKSLGGRHNKKFEEALENVNILVKEDGPKGYLDQKPDPELQEVLDGIKKRFKEVFQLYRNTNPERKRGPRNKTTKERPPEYVEWRCGCPPPKICPSIPAGDSIHGVCLDCDAEYKSPQDGLGTGKSSETVEVME